MKTYSYTRTLKEVDAEFMLYGVQVCARNGFVQTWWNVPVKYSIQVLLSRQLEFIDFMATTGVDLDIICERAVDGKLRVWFRHNIDYSMVIRPTYPEGTDATEKMCHIMYDRNVAINAAANYAANAKRLFMDFIRAHFFEARVLRQMQESTVVCSATSRAMRAAEGYSNPHEDGRCGR